ncbi:hypothetical protein DPMN_070470 [Dreissena polymorpha]|uniref:Uncharacterized protein n=1 Tax=Dreissena polymorpha TaxID=45954 RepID=A0A9D4BVN9_DREPO|nr:hypothetical protein DPMN_070470 [Dreissena polymorpha]
MMKRASINKEEEYQEVTDDPDDDIPLAKLAKTFGSTSTIEDYISIDSNLQATDHGHSRQPHSVRPSRYGNKGRRCNIIRRRRDHSKSTTEDVREVSHSCH